MSCCGSACCLLVARVNIPIPLFIVIGLVLFFFCCLVRFPSLSAMGESLGGGGGGGGSSHSSPHCVRVRRRWSLFVWLSGP